MERDDEPGSIGRTRVACQPLFPGKTPMRALGASKDARSSGSDKRRGKRGGAFQADRFTADHFQPDSSDAAARPVLPHHRRQREPYVRLFTRRRGSGRSSVTRPKHRAHSPRFDRGAAFLTLSTQGAGAAMANTRSIQDPQGTIALGTPFLGIQRMIGRATQGSIWLRRKRGAGKAMSKRGTCPLGRTIDDHRRGLFSRDGLDGRSGLSLQCGSKCGDAQIC